MLIVAVLLSVFVAVTGVVVYRKFKDFNSTGYFLKVFPSSPSTKVFFPNPVVTPNFNGDVMVTGQAHVVFLDLDGNQTGKVFLQFLSLECSAPKSVVLESSLIKNVTVSSFFGDFSSFSATFTNDCVVSLDMV